MSRSGAIAVTAAVLAVGSILTAQHALDRNLQVGSGGYNTRVSSGRSLQRPIYSINRTTGNFQYNRANAFNDPAYSIYQRYTLDRTAYFKPSTGRRSAAATHRPAATTHRPAAPAPTTVLGHSTYSVSSSYRSRRTAPTDRAASMRRTASLAGTRSATKAMMQQPRYASLPSYSR